MKFGIDFFRHVLAIAVIVVHMTSSRYSTGTNIELGHFVNWIDGAVAGFFFISGYLSKEQPDVSEYARKQAIRLLAPFFLFSIMYAVALAILGKGSLGEGLVRTLTLHGSGMQLYFLPYLLLISVGHALWGGILSRGGLLWTLVAPLVALIFLCLSLPTEGSTGSDYKLLPFYWTAYLLGITYRSTASRKNLLLGVTSTLSFLLVLGFTDPRFFDLAGVIFLFSFFYSIRKYLPDTRLPGSGGVYLLHTPIINFSISVALMHFGITELANITMTVLVTYIVCLSLTLGLIAIRPGYRWLILE